MIVWKVWILMITDIWVINEIQKVKYNNFADTSLFLKSWITRIREKNICKKVDNINAIKKCITELSMFFSYFLNLLNNYTWFFKKVNNQENKKNSN